LKKVSDGAEAVKGKAELDSDTGEGQRVAEIPDEEVIAMAKAILRQTILKSGWYPSLSDTDRQKRIDQDVDLHWPLMLRDARKRLEEEQDGGS
jgi:hypothetical protein